MRLNLSQYAFVEIPDELPLTANNKLNIIFQYRWHAAAPPDKSNIKAVYVYADHPGLNSGNPGELGSIEFINKSLDKILDKTKAELGKVGLAAYSGGGLGLYHLFKDKNKFISLPDAIVSSDATYGGNAVIKIWSEMAKDYTDSEQKIFIILHTRSLENNFDSTTKTTNGIIKNLNINNYVVNIDDDAYWAGWPSKPKKWVQKGGLIILDTNLTHSEAGKIVPVIFNSFLIDWI